MKDNLRFIVYCPPQWRDRRPVYGRGTLAAMAEHSRPVYRVLDCANVAKGNNPELPEHSTALPVADGLDYVAACKKARELNAKPGAQTVLAITKELEQLGLTTWEQVEQAKRKAYRAKHLLAARAAYDRGDMTRGNEMKHYAGGL